MGGLIINGDAPINCAASAGGACEGEGNSGAYGGPDRADNGGVLRYVRVEFAGARITDEGEYNGIAFQGVGSNSTVEHLHVHLPWGYGIEFFGGSVRVKWVVITGAGDFSLETTFGYDGNVQFVLVQQHEEEADRGIEGDSNKGGPDIAPRSHLTISNVTFIRANAPNTQTAILVRRGTNLTLTNAVTSNFEKFLDIDDAATIALQNEMTISNSIFDCTASVGRRDG